MRKRESLRQALHWCSGLFQLQGNFRELQLFLVSFCWFFFFLMKVSLCLFFSLMHKFAADNGLSVPRGDVGVCVLVFFNAETEHSEYKIVVFPAALVK